MPALNEEKNLEAAVNDIARCFEGLGVDYEVLLFDDHSDDRTGEVADQLARTNSRLRVFHNAQRMNIGGIFKAGVRLARYDYCVLLPGDNEVVVDEVAKCVHCLDHADLVLTYIANQEIRPFLRRFLSQSYTRVVNALFGVNFMYTNGSNFCRTDLLRGIRINTDGFSYQTEAVVKLVRQGVNHIEVGINLRGRAHGESTALALRNWVKVFRAIATLWWDIRIVNRSKYGQVGRKLACPTPDGRSKERIPEGSGE